MRHTLLITALVFVSSFLSVCLLGYEEVRALIVNGQIGGLLTLAVAFVVACFASLLALALLLIRYLIKQGR